MIKRISTKLIPLIEINFTHQWENNRNRLGSRYNWKKKELGIWYKESLMLGKPTTGMAVNEIFSEDNIIKAHSFGINLIFCRFWVLLSFKKLLK